MEFKISNDILMAAVSDVQPVIPKNPTLPILNHILMTAENKSLSLRVTNLEQSVTVTVPTIKISGKGSSAINSARLFKLLKGLPDDTELNCKQQNNTLEITTPTGKFFIPTISAEEFPNTETKTSGNTITLDKSFLFDIANKLSFAVAKDDLRPAMTGICLQIHPDSNLLTAVATDGHRLMKLTHKVEELEVEKNIEVIFPVNALSMITRLISEEAENVIISFDNNRMDIDLDTAFLTSRLIEGHYPHFDSVIPKENENEIIIDRQDLIQATRLADTFTNPINHQVILKIDKNGQTISAEDTEDGSKGIVTLDGNHNGDEIIIGFNALYLIDNLKHINGDNVIVLMDGPTTAVIVNPEVQEAMTELLTVVMPVRLG